MFLHSRGRLGRLLLRQTETGEIDVRSLIEQHVSRACLIFSEVSDEICFLDGFHVFVVAEHPLSLGFDSGDVMPLIGTTISRLVSR
jgi:hypothetical protein